MTVTRAEVLTAMAAHSSPSPPQRTSVGELAAALGADCRTVREQVAHLADCGLVRHDDDDDGVRVTRVGAAVAAMDVDDVVVVDTDGEQ